MSAQTLDMQARCPGTPEGAVAPRGRRAEPGPLAQAVWVFVLCSFAGLVIEEVYHLAVYGELQDRAGLLFGPFSPVYGVGGLVAVALARLLEGRGAITCFIAFALAGGAVEFATSWLMEFAFGMVAWDYAGSFLSIDGRTNGYFMLMWGILGLACMKLFVPALDRLVAPLLRKASPFVTRAVACSMALDIALTLVAFNCWYHRAEGSAPETPTQRVCAEVFDDEFMESRFQAVSVQPGSARW